MELLIDGPDNDVSFILAHGAGVGMDAPFMQFFAEQLAERGLRVVRFEFPYMQRRRETGRNSPPNRPEVLRARWLEVIDSQPAGALVLGGKSMGGRIASLIADEVSAAAVVCLGYPFHPPGKPDVLRTEHLKSIGVPTLIVQGARDPFGNQAEVAEYALSGAIRTVWLDDGDHSFVPRKSSGVTQQQNLDRAVEAIIAFVDETVRGK